MGIIEMLEISARFPAIKSCAPYGIIAWAIHEKVSKSDAAFCGSILELRLISFAIGAAITIATVLLAVAKSNNIVKSPMPSIAFFFA